MILRALLLFLTLSYSNTASAADALHFSAPASYKERLVINSLSKSAELEHKAYLIAKVDLNNDAIDEYIIKPKTCKTLGFCPHYIIALPKYQPLSIGHFDAHAINIENNSIYGIKHLRIYGNPDNNFTYSTARWNPFSFQYDGSIKSNAQE